MNSTSSAPQIFSVLMPRSMPASVMPPTMGTEPGTLSCARANISKNTSL